MHGYRTRRLTAHFGKPDPEALPWRFPSAAAAFRLALALATLARLMLPESPPAVRTDVADTDATETVDMTEASEESERAAAVGMAVWLAVKVAWWTSAPVSLSARVERRRGSATEESLGREDARDLHPLR